MKPPRFNIATAGRMLRPLAIIGGCATLAGCISAPFTSAKVDPASPVAAEVAKAARAGHAYPKFSDIPAIPADVRPLRAFGQAAQQVKLAGDRLVAATAPGTWTLTGTESFASEARRQTPDLPPSERASDPEAFARELRERATPPPRR